MRERERERERAKNEAIGNHKTQRYEHFLKGTIIILGTGLDVSSSFGKNLKDFVALNLAAKYIF